MRLQAQTGRLCATSRSARRIRHCAVACGIWPMSGGGSATGGCSCSCGVRESRRGSTACAGTTASFVESFNGRLRDEFLNETLFRDLAHARELISAWVTDYNTERPHSALGYQTPAGFALYLTNAIARPATRVQRSARRAIAQPTPKGVNDQPAQVTAG